MYTNIIFWFKMEPDSIICPLAVELNHSHFESIPSNILIKIVILRVIIITHCYYVLCTKYIECIC